MFPSIFFGLFLGDFRLFYLIFRIFRAFRTFNLFNPWAYFYPVVLKNGQETWKFDLRARQFSHFLLFFSQIAQFSHFLQWTTIFLISIMSFFVFFWILNFQLFRKFRFLRTWPTKMASYALKFHSNPPLKISCTLSKGLSFTPE